MALVWLRLISPRSIVTQNGPKGSGRKLSIFIPLMSLNMFSYRSFTNLPMFSHSTSLRNFYTKPQCHLLLCHFWNCFSFLIFGGSAITWVYSKFWKHFTFKICFPITLFICQFSDCWCKNYEKITMAELPYMYTLNFLPVTLICWRHMSFVLLPFFCLMWTLHFPFSMHTIYLLQHTKFQLSRSS